MKPHLFALLSILGLSVPGASATSAGVYLPLVNVGTQLRWSNTPDDFRLVVSAPNTTESSPVTSSPVRLEVYSPNLNLNDYASKRDNAQYIGDERYNNANFFTRFRLRDPKNQVVTERTFGLGQSHAWFTLLNQSLRPGTYPLEIRSGGYGKNAFGLVAGGNVRLEASQFTVNARGQPGTELTAARLPVPQSLIGQRVRISNYDADGENELVLSVIYPNGKRRRLASSGDLAWASQEVLVTKELVGTWQIVARIGKKSRQFSNSFALRLGSVAYKASPLYAQLPVSAPNNPTRTPLTPPAPPSPPPPPVVHPEPLGPISVLIVDEAGEVVQDTSYGVTGEAQRRVNLRLPEGYVRAHTEITVGDGVLEDQGNTVLVGVRGASIRFTVRQTRATLTVQSVAELGSRRINLENVPVTVNGQTQPSGSSFGLKPGSWTVEPTALPGAQAQPVTVTLEDGTSQTVTIVYRVEAKLKLTADRSRLTVSEPVKLTATASTAFPYPVPVTIALTPPGELRSQARLRLEGQIQTDRPLTLEVLAEAVAPSATATVAARLQPFDLTDTTPLEIEAPPTVNPPPPPSAPTQADLEVTHSAEPNPIEIGNTTTYTINLTNFGPDAAQNARVRFPLIDGAKLESWSASQGSCTVTATALECSLDRLEPGATGLVLVVIKPTAIGLLNTTITATSDATDPNAANDTNAFTLAVNPPPAPPAKLVLTREPVTPSPALPGELVTVRLKLANIGGTGTDFVLTDDPGTSLHANLSGFEGHLEPGEERELSYTARVEPGLPMSGNLRARAEGPDLEPVLADTPFERVNLGLTKAASLTVSARPGAPIPFVITLTNPVNRALALQLEGQAPGLRLEPDESGAISLNALETKTVTVIGTALEAGRFTNTVKLTLEGVIVAPSASASLDVIALPTQERESTTTLRVRVAQTPQGDVIVSDRLPPGASYTPGSSQVDGRPITDPLVVDDRLFWVFVSGLSGDHTITYGASHAGALVTPEDQLGVLLRLPGTANREPTYRVLVGDPDLIASFKLAQQPASAAPTRQRVGALIVNPATGTRYRDRDQINVTVDVPLRAENITLSVNGEIVAPSKIGTKTFDEGTGRTTLEYVAVKLKPGRNQITLSATDNGQSLEDQAEVLVSGSPVSIQIQPNAPITNDANDRPALRITVLDANHLPAQDGMLTLESSPEPAVADANPNEPGLQVRYENGAVIVPLSTVGTRTVIRAEARIGPVRGTAEFPVLAGARPPIVVGSLGLELRGGAQGFSVTGSLQGFVRTTLWESYLLTVGVNQQASVGTDFSASGNLTPPSNEFTRFPLLGDTSTHGSDTGSTDGFYARLERGASFVQYGQFSAGFTGRLSNFGARMNGLQGLYREDHLSLTAFGAFAPRTNLTNVDTTNPYGFAGDGTGLYKLANAPIQPGSERVRLVLRDKDGLTILHEQELERLKDYAIDNLSGIITLSRPLQPTDENGNPQFLVVDYASEASDVPLEFRLGAQGRLDLGDWTLQATALQYSAGKPLLTALGAGYAASGFRAEAELGYAGDWALSSALGFRSGGFEANLSFQNLGANYVGPSTATSNGADLNLTANYSVTNSLKLSANLALGQRYATGETREEYGLNASNDFGGFSLNLGLHGLAASSLNGQGALVWDTNVYLIGGLKVPLGPVTLGLEQRVPISAGTPGQTVFSLGYALTDSVKIEFRDALSYDGTNQGTLGVRGSFGTTNLTAAYDLPGVNGESARGRVGIDTTIPLGSGFSANLGGSIEAPLGQALSASANLGLGYAFEQTRANANAQFSITPAGFKQVYSLGAVIQPSSSPSVLSPKLEITSGPEGAGLLFSAAGAYRGAGLSLLTNHQIRTGIYAPNGDTLEGEVQAVDAFSTRFSLRGGLAYKVSSGVFTGQVNAGATWWTSDRFGVGSSLVWAFQPAYGFRVAWGIEGSLRLADGLVLTGGMNLIGFDGGIGSVTTAPGFYLRLEFLFDENTFGLGDSSPASPITPIAPIAPGTPQTPSQTK